MKLIHILMILIVMTTVSAYTITENVDIHNNSKVEFNYLNSSFDKLIFNEKKYCNMYYPIFENVTDQMNVTTLQKNGECDEYLLYINETIAFVTERHDTLMNPQPITDTFDIIQADVAIFGTIYDTSSPWNHNFSVTRSCLMDINLSADEVQHDTYCEELIDYHPTTNQKLRDTMKMQGMTLQLWQWGLPALEIIWEWKTQLDIILPQVYSSILTNQNKISALEIENEMLNNRTMEICTVLDTFSWC